MLVSIISSGNFSLNSNQKPQVNQSDINNSKPAFGMKHINERTLNKAIDMMVEKPQNEEVQNLINFLKTNDLYCKLKILPQKLIEYTIFCSNSKRTIEGGGAPLDFLSGLIKDVHNLIA